MDTNKLKSSAVSAASATGKHLGGAVSAAAPALANGASATLERLIENRGLRVALVGTAFVVVGLELGSDSAWSVPVFAIGAVLILAGALGTRLSGRLSLDWGEDGASFEMRARIAPSASARAGEPGKQLSVLDAHSDPALAETVIEGSGETIEMDLIQLREMLPEEQGSAEGESPERAAS